MGRYLSRHPFPGITDAGYYLNELTSVSEYSIFRRAELVLTMRVDVDSETKWAKIESDPINKRWQPAMSAISPVKGTPSGNCFPMMKESFHLP